MLVFAEYPYGLFAQVCRYGEYSEIDIRKILGLVIGFDALDSIGFRVYDVDVPIEGRP